MADKYRKLVGYALCGSFCTIKASLEQAEILRESYDLLPIVSEKVGSTDTRFGRACDTLRELERICGREAVCDIVGAEPLGPVIKLDALVVAPCTGNTLAKTALGITDGCVTMAIKAHSRQSRPVVLCIATNDALSAGMRNLAALFCRRNFYFVPMAQDDTEKKPYSLVCDFRLLPETLSEALEGRQIRPVFTG